MTAARAHGRRGATRRRAGERGVTLVELMVGTAVVSIVLAGTMGFLIFQTRVQNASKVRSDLLAAGQAAMAVMEREITLAGFDLPRRLAIKEHQASADPCDAYLTVASVDPLRQWTASATDANSVTLDSATPQPASPGDEPIGEGSWLFLYRHARGASSPPIADAGHGMVEVDARDAGNDTLTVTDVNFSAHGQSTLDLDATAPINQAGITGGPIKVLRAKVSRFGVDCTGANPYLYWERAGYGSPVPLVSTVKRLEFGFLFDADHDGQPDDTDGDGAIGPGDLSDTGPLDSVMAVHVRLELRSDQPDPAIDNRYREQVFAALIRTPNVHTLGSDEDYRYQFIDNSGL